MNRHESHEHYAPDPELGAKLQQLRKTAETEGWNLSAAEFDKAEAVISGLVRTENVSLHPNLDNNMVTFNALWDQIKKVHPRLELTSGFDEQPGRFELTSTGAPRIPNTIDVVELTPRVEHSFARTSIIDQSYRPSPSPVEHLDAGRSGMEVLSYLLQRPNSIESMDGQTNPYMWMLGCEIVDKSGFLNPQIPLVGRIDNRLFFAGFWREAGGYNGASMPTTEYLSE